MRKYGIWNHCVAYHENLARLESGAPRPHKKSHDLRERTLRLTTYSGLSAQARHHSPLY